MAFYDSSKSLTDSLGMFLFICCFSFAFLFSLSLSNNAWLKCIYDHASQRSNPLLTSHITVWLHVGDRVGLMLLRCMPLCAANWLNAAEMYVIQAFSLRGEPHFLTSSQSLYIRTFAWEEAYAAFLCVSKLYTWGPWYSSAGGKILSHTPFWGMGYAGITEIIKLCCCYRTEVFGCKDPDDVKCIQVKLLSNSCHPWAICCGISSSQHSFVLHNPCKICLAGRITGARKPRGSYIELTMDSLPRVVMEWGVTSRLD